MCKAEIPAGTDNLKWIARDDALSSAIHVGVMHDIAILLKNRQDIFPTPLDSLNFFNEQCGSSSIVTSDSSSVLSQKYFAIFCREIFDVYNANRLKKAYLSANKPLQTRRISGRVSCVKSFYEDAAFNEFSKYMDSYSPVYCSDFQSTCEDVYYDRSDFCILPLETSSTGLLWSFRKLIKKFELRIFAACGIESDEDETQIFSLVGNPPLTVQGNYMEISVPAESDNDLYGLFSSLEVLEAGIRRVSALPSTYRNDKYDYHICLNVSNCNTEVVKYYLDAIYPKHVLYGLYSIYNTERKDRR